MAVLRARWSILLILGLLAVGFPATLVQVKLGTLGKVRFLYLPDDFVQK